MTIVLIALFFITDRYRKKEIERMKYEAKYYESVLKFKKNPEDSEAKKEAFISGQQYGQKLGMLDNEIESMLNRDLKV